MIYQNDDCFKIHFIAMFPIKKHFKNLFYRFVCAFLSAIKGIVITKPVVTIQSRCDIGISRNLISPSIYVHSQVDTFTQS